MIFIVDVFSTYSGFHWIYIQLYLSFFNILNVCRLFLRWLNICSFYCWIFIQCIAVNLQCAFTLRRHCSVIAECFSNDCFIDFLMLWSSLCWKLVRGSFRVTIKDSFSFFVENSYFLQFIRRKIYKLVKTWELRECICGKSRKGWTKIMPEHTIHFDNKTERNKFLKQCLRNKIICQLCESNSFKVEHNSLDQIVLTCINCGWIHIINNAPSVENKTYLKLSYEDDKK